MSVCVSTVMHERAIELETAVTRGDHRSHRVLRLVHTYRHTFTHHTHTHILSLSHTHSHTHTILRHKVVPLYFDVRTNTTLGWSLFQKSLFFFSYSFWIFCFLSLDVGQSREQTTAAVSYWACMSVFLSFCLGESLFLGIAAAATLCVCVFLLLLL